jgi:hypothetical protein
MEHRFIEPQAWLSDEPGDEHSVTIADLAAEHIEDLPSEELAFDSVQHYLQEIGCIALLSAAEEVELAQRMERGRVAAHRLTLAVVGQSWLRWAAESSALEWSGPSVATIWLASSRWAGEHVWSARRHRGMLPNNLTLHHAGPIGRKEFSPLQEHIFTSCPRGGTLVDVSWARLQPARCFAPMLSTSNPSSIFR